MRQFAEQEIYLPSGKFEARRWNSARNPFAGALLDVLGSGKYRRSCITGNQQSGKSLNAFVIPTIFHLFETKDDVICGLPDMDMAIDKWKSDILPVIERTKYRDLLPRSGFGSKGGSVRRIDFRNGKWLRFMSGGGGDKSRAGATARVLVVTETDGLDEAGGGSREADKLTQLEGRTRAHADRARIYLECTVSVEEGRTWREYNAGTQSRLAIRCPHCRQFGTPEREHLVGWKDATDVISAGLQAHLCCPKCGQMWTEEDRAEANADFRLVHRGQDVGTDGVVLGPEPATDTLGFRWTAANNMLVPMSLVAQEEWKAARLTDEENAEKQMRQFVWTLPHKPAKVDLTQLDGVTIARRFGNYAKGVVPTETQHLVVSIDLGLRLGHWDAVAFDQHAGPSTIDYGRIEIASDLLGPERAIMSALRTFRDEVIAKGWAGDSPHLKPALVLVDGGYHQATVDAFVAESGDQYFCVKGFGVNQISQSRERNGKVVSRGDECWFVQVPGYLKPLLEINVDYWKTWLHQRIQTPLDQPGAMTLYRPLDANEHVSIAKHLTAEKQVEEFVPGKGTVVRWQVLHRNNHWLDAKAYACCGANLLGARLHSSAPMAAEPQPETAKERVNPITNYRKW